ncbi:MAG: hypothetical protein ABL870_04985 [Sediminibacterium sp.]
MCIDQQRIACNPIQLLFLTSSSVNQLGFSSGPDITKFQRSRKPCSLCVTINELPFQMKVSVCKILCLIVSIIVLFSCASNHDSRPSNFERKIEEIENAITILREQNESLYRIVATRLQDKKTYKKASVWVPKFEYLETIEIGINNYIMSNLIKDIGIRNTEVFYKRLNSYKYAVLNIAPEIPIALRESADNVTNQFDSAKLNNPGHFNEYLSSLPRIQKNIILRATIYNLLKTQLEILKFCDAQTK